MWIKERAELDYFVLTFKTVADRWGAVYRLRQQCAYIQVCDVGEDPKRLQLHVWLPKKREPHPLGGPALGPA